MVNKLKKVVSTIWNAHQDYKQLMRDIKEELGRPNSQRIHETIETRLESLDFHLVSEGKISQYQSLDERFIFVSEAHGDFENYFFIDTENKTVEIEDVTRFVKKKNLANNLNLALAAGAMLLSSGYLYPKIIANLQSNPTTLEKGLDVVGITMTAVLGYLTTKLDLGSKIVGVFDKEFKELNEKTSYDAQALEPLLEKNARYCVNAIKEVDDVIYVEAMEQPLTDLSKYTPEQISGYLSKILDTDKPFVTIAMPKNGEFRTLSPELVKEGDLTISDKITEGCVLLGLPQGSYIKLESQEITYLQGV